MMLILFLYMLLFIKRSTVQVLVYVLIVALHADECKCNVIMSSFLPAASLLFLSSRLISSQLF